MHIDVGAALASCGIRSDKRVEYFRVRCPLHDDTVPSADIHHKTGQFYCYVCRKGLSLANYLSVATKKDIFKVKELIGYKSDCKNPVDPRDIIWDHEQLWSYPQLLEALHYRCITDEIIRKRMLGVKDAGREKRISIPIQNDVGQWANLRLYLPGAANFKFMNLKQRDKQAIRFYPVEQLEYDSILICGGELKAAAAAEILNQYDIGAVAPTCGENVWPNEQNWRFQNKLIWINCDVDETGKRYSEVRCRALQPFAREIRKVVFTTEEVGGELKGDLNDFLRLKGDIYNKLMKTPEWKFVPSGVIADDTPLTLDFREAFEPKHVGKKIIVPTIISAVSSENFLISSVVEVICPRDQEFCQHCDVNSQQMLLTSKGTLGTVMTISPENPNLLALIGEKTEYHYKTYKETFRIPPKCRLCKFDRKEAYSITEVRLDEELETNSRLDPLLSKVGFVVNGPPSIEPETHLVTGRLYPSPKTQVSSFLISDIKRTRDALEAYIPSHSSELLLFRPIEWTVEGIEQKLNEIYEDFEANITRIYQRRDLHLAVDLAYHSVLHFYLGDNALLNGWLELFIVGDTSEGKSEITKKLQEHYKLGVTVDCRNATAPGLLIGLDSQAGKGKHFAVYGTYPKNDRKLVIFEELKDMAENIFTKFTEVRSSGIVKITKIESKTKKARVRLIAISNCQDMREVDSYAYGVDAAMGVVGRYEDLRRFDIVLVVGKHDVDRKLLDETRLHPPVVPHHYTDLKSEELVLKAWKCEPDMVKFEDISHLLQTTSRLTDKFGLGPPILNTNAAHLKVAKLSAALAARTNSYEAAPNGGEYLLVRKCHVDYIEKYLDRIYCSGSMKLNEKTSAVKAASMLRDPEALSDFIKGLPNAKGIVVRLISEDKITGNFIRDIVGDFHSGSSFYAKLIQSNALHRIKGENYSKSTAFSELLKVLEQSMKRPDYLPPEGKY